MTKLDQTIDRLMTEHPDQPASWIANHPEVVAIRKEQEDAKQWAIDKAAIAQAEHDAAVRAAHPGAAASMAAKRAARKAERK